MPPLRLATAQSLPIAIERDGKIERVRFIEVQSLKGPIIWRRENDQFANISVKGE